MAMKKRSNQDIVYDYVKNLIAAKAIFPGNRIPDEEIIRQTGVSRSSIRPALVRLSYDGLVEIIPNRGAFVVKPNAEDMRQVFRIRQVLEAGALREACENRTGRQLQAMARNLKEQEKLLEKIENQIAAEAAKKAQELEASGGVVSASGFMWPCPSSHRITSYFGPRSQPTAGASTNHKGIDIGAASGSTIVASADGVVTTATYSSSAGNYIVISHGGGISTVYMHCSSLYVSVGTKVSQGQSIAAVGSTGYSTGPHLHFGVIKNGTYVNPLDYVS